SEGKRRYDAKETAGWTAGITAHLGDADLSLSYGGRFKQAKGFGFGDRSFSLAMAYDLGNVDGRKPKPRFADEVEKELNRESSAKTKAEDQKAEQAKVNVEEEFPEMIGADIHPLDLFKDEQDDFSATEKEMEAYNKVTTPGFDEQVENELEALKIQEEKQAAEEAKRAE